MNLNKVDCADGGTLQEIHKDEWGQVTVRHIVGKTEPHRHLLTNEWWLVLKGRLKITVETLGTWYFYPWDTINIPAGIGHYVENPDDEPATFLFVADRIYDAENPDREDWEQ